MLVLAAAILSVLGKATLSPGIVGLAVSHSLQVRNLLSKSKSHACYFLPIKEEVLKKNTFQVTGILSWIVRAWTDVENNIVSVERVKEYAETKKEVMLV